MIPPSRWEYHEGNEMDTPYHDSDCHHERWLGGAAYMLNWAQPSHLVMIETTTQDLGECINEHIML